MALLKKFPSPMKMANHLSQVTMPDGSLRLVGCTNTTASTTFLSPPAILITSPTPRARTQADPLYLEDTFFSQFWDGQHITPSLNFKGSGTFSIMIVRFQEALTINAASKSLNWSTTLRELLRRLNHDVQCNS